jgi:hypothetical protein
MNAGQIDQNKATLQQGGVREFVGMRALYHTLLTTGSAAAASSSSSSDISASDSSSTDPASSSAWQLDVDVHVHHGIGTLKSSLILPI